MKDLKEYINESIKQRLSEAPSSLEDLVMDILSYLPDRFQPEVEELDDDMIPIYSDEDILISVSRDFVSAEVNPAKAKSYSLQFSAKGGKITDLSVVSDHGEGSNDDLIDKKYSIRDAKKIAKDIQKYLSL